MRLALQRLLAHPSAVSLLRNAVQSDGASFCQQNFPAAPTQGQWRRYPSKEREREQHPGSPLRTLHTWQPSVAAEDDEEAEGPIERSLPEIPKANARLPHAQRTGEVDGEVESVGLSTSTVLSDPQVVPMNQPYLRSGNSGSRGFMRLPIKAKKNRKSWESRLATFEQYQYESDLRAQTSQAMRLVNDPEFAQDWEFWLELVTFRNRHHGAEGTMEMCREILRRGLLLPTRGIVANRLWDLLTRAGSCDPMLLEEMVAYAKRRKRSTGMSWSGMYDVVISAALKENPDSAYSWHLKLKDDFPPSLRDYRKIFCQSLVWGCSGHFRGLYKDLPVIGMYRTSIINLCKWQMYDEALRWHDILYDAGDFPVSFFDIKPLLDRLAYIGDVSRLDKVSRVLTEAKVEFSSAAENFFRGNETISRELMNRRLGEIHGVGPKHLRDDFCARLFATHLFSVETIISGLRMMAVEVIGPLSLREIAARENCDPGAICRRTDDLKNAGISLDDSVFCALVWRLAVEDKHQILKSIVDCDLHPDTFADLNLQERLLAQYYDEKDLMKMERTFAVLTTFSSVKDMQMVRMNLILRCQVTLGRREEVLATLEEIKRMNVPVSARSSRHLRVLWLSRRQVGRSAEETTELAILIQASQMTMQTGRFVPIIAWREILRRLGMAGRLVEFENLALWLVDWYSSPAVEDAFLKRLLSRGKGGQALTEGHASPGRLPNRDRNPQRFLSTLFTTSARHAIVAWGFQHIVTPFKSFRSLKGVPMVEDTPQFQWAWGLHLLYKLRERGVPIRAREVARICRHRLNTLFGPGVSKRKINRQARSRLGSLDSYAEKVYIRKMEAIWGKGLFRTWRHVGRNLKKRIRVKRQKVRQRKK